MKNKLSYSSARGTKPFHYRKVAIAAIGLAIGIWAGEEFRLESLPLFLIAIYVVHLFSWRFVRDLMFWYVVGAVIFTVSLPASINGEGNVSGYISEAPEESRYGYTIILDDIILNGEQINGRASLNISKKSMTTLPEYGQHIYISHAAIETPKSASDEDEFDERAYYLSNYIAYIGRATGEISVQGKRENLYGHILSLREMISDNLIKMHGEDVGALAIGMILGDKSGIHEDVREEFERSGMSHLLAVSGLHVSLLFVALMYLLRKTRMCIRNIAIVSFLAVYCTLCAFSPSILRASIMSIVVLIGQSFKRKSDTLTSLSFAAMLLLIINPFYLFSAGFLLSFSAVYGILMLASPLKDAMGFLPNAAAGSIGVTLSAQIGTIPVSLAYFGEIPITGMFSNLFAIPFAGFAIIPSLLGALLYDVIRPLSELLSVIAGGALNFISYMAYLSSRYPLFSIESMPMSSSAMFMLSLLFFSRYCMLSFKTRLGLGSICLSISFLTWVMFI